MSHLEQFESNLPVRAARGDDLVSDLEKLFQRRLEEMDREVARQLADRYRGLVPQERIEAMLCLPTIFQDRPQFNQDFQRVDSGARTGDGVLGWSRGTRDSAHVSLDHSEIRKTLAHERLHQLSDPLAERALGKQLYEGVTEDLAIRAMGSPEAGTVDVCYEGQTMAAQDLRAKVGARAIDAAYFQGDTEKLRQAVDRIVGSGGLAKLRQELEQRYGEPHEIGR